MEPMGAQKRVQAGEATSRFSSALHMDEGSRPQNPEDATNGAKGEPVKHHPHWNVGGRLCDREPTKRVERFPEIEKISSNDKEQRRPPVQSAPLADVYFAQLFDGFRRRPTIGVTVRI